MQHHEIKNRVRSFFCVFGIAALSLYSSGAGASNISYTYDPAGRLVAADYGAGKSISYAYDNAGNLFLSSQPAPGLLVSRASANQINIFWPAAPTGFGLYSSGSLGTGGQWNYSTANQFQMGDLNGLTQTLGSTNTFYRLQQ